MATIRNFNVMSNKFEDLQNLYLTNLYLTNTFYAKIKLNRNNNTNGSGL